LSETTEFLGLIAIIGAKILPAVGLRRSVQGRNRNAAEWRGLTMLKWRWSRVALSIAVSVTVGRNAALTTKRTLVWDDTGSPPVNKTVDLSLGPHA